MNKEVEKMKKKLERCENYGNGVESEIAELSAKLDIVIEYLSKLMEES